MSLFICIVVHRQPNSQKKKTNNKITTQRIKVLTVNMENKKYLSAKE